MDLIMYTLMETVIVFSLNRAHDLCAAKAMFYQSSYKNTMLMNVAKTH